MQPLLHCLEIDKLLHRMYYDNDPLPEDPDIVYVPEESRPADDPLAETRPRRAYSHDPLAESGYHYIDLPPRPRPPSNRRSGCCLAALLIPAILLAALLAYLLAPFRANVLLLGLDARPDEGLVARSDTIILTTIIPLRPYVGALSIPRDLWVDIPGVGENRINTAHFFAEAANAGAGPSGAMHAVRANFGVDVDYYVRLRFDGFKEVVDAMGGIEIDLPAPMSGYPAGRHLLDGTQALALVRDRQGADDFFRMERGQIFLRSVIGQVMKPSSWPHLPKVFIAAGQATDTNLPAWLWPRLAVALFRAGPDGIDTRSITRDMVTPFTTSGGAQVLGPNWDRINPVLLEMFGQ